MPRLIHPVINGMFVVPVRLLERGRTNLHSLRKELTADHFNVETGETTKVRLYREERGYFAMPREFGREEFPELWDKALDRTTKPTAVPKLYPSTITPRDDDQAQFMRSIDNVINSGVYGGVEDCQINAQTGTGKTVAALNGLARAEISNALVIVHRNRVKDQWKGSVSQNKGMRFFFGEQWTHDHVGLVQQEEFEVHKRAVVVAMGPTLISRAFPRWFYEHFGVIIVDELHKFATPMLNDCLGMFNAAVRIGMTATEKEGSMAKVVSHHLGKPKIVSEQEAMQPTVVRILHPVDTKYTEEQDNARTLTMLLARSKSRNKLLADIIKQRGYDNGRRCLAIGDRVKQLQSLRNLLIDDGVPEEDIGLYVGEYETGRYKPVGRLRDGASDSILKRMAGREAFDTIREAKEAARAWTERKDIEDAWVDAERAGVEPYFEIDAVREKRKPTEEEYNGMEDNCQIILATYGIFDVAIDISELDWGIECTPRADVRQAVGRVLRLKDGKKTPAWYTIEDKLTMFVERELFSGSEIVPKLMNTPLRLAKQRRKSYIAQNAIIRKVKDPYAALKA